MKKFTYLTACFAIFFSSLSLADAASEKEAEKLLVLVGMDNMLEQSVAQMLDLQIQGNPAMAPFREIMLQFLNKYMSYESLKPELIKIYADAFSAKELKEINAFYATDTGKKAVSLMPTLMAQGSQVGAQRVQQNVGELQRMIQEEAQKMAPQAPQ